MIIGYLLCGMVFGMICAVMTFLSGFGILGALLAYSLGGILGVMLSLVPALLMQSRQDEQTGALALGS